MALKAPPNPNTGVSLRSLKPSSSLFSNRPCMVRVQPLKSSFFGNQVVERKVSQLRLTYDDRLRCHSHGGGALGSGMNIFGRFARIVKSYVTSILSSFEDPEKIIEQAVIDMNEDLMRMHQAAAQVLASQKQLENKYEAAQKASEKWYQKAQFALGKGDEELAREALKRRKSFADTANALKLQLGQQKVIVDNLVSNTRLLEGKIMEARSKKDALRARSTAAKTAMKVQEMIGTVDASSALSAFEKMEEKVLTMESQAEGLNQLTSDKLEEKFKILEGSTIDDDLAELKREQSRSSKKAELPPGRTAVLSGKPFPFQASEIEMELNDLRRRANEY